MQNMREVRSYLGCAVFILCVLVVNIFIISLVRVDGVSMSPFLNHNDIILISKISEAQVNDVVVIENENRIYLIKRVIGMGGDSVVITDDSLIVNETVIDHIQNSIDKEYYYSINVPEGYIFVLGDNRLNSIDSRDFSCIRTENVVGVFLMKFSGVGRYMG